MKKFLAIITLAAVSAAMAVVPGRVGPVSTYGKLVANGGKLSGSCPSYKDKTVQVKGMRNLANVCQVPFSGLME